MHLKLNHTHNCTSVGSLRLIQIFILLFTLTLCLFSFTLQWLYLVWSPTHGCCAYFAWYTLVIWSKELWEVHTQTFILYGKRIVFFPLKSPSEKQKNGVKSLHFMHKSREPIEFRIIFPKNTGPMLDMSDPSIGSLAPSCIVCVRISVGRLYLMIMLTCLLHIHMTRSIGIYNWICVISVQPARFHFAKRRGSSHSARKSF